MIHILWHKIHLFFHVIKLHSSFIFIQFNYLDTLFIIFIYFTHDLLIFLRVFYSFLSYWYFVYDLLILKCDSFIFSCNSFHRIHLFWIISFFTFDFFIWFICTCDFYMITLVIIHSFTIYWFSHMIYLFWHVIKLLSSFIFTGVFYRLFLIFKYFDELFTYFWHYFILYIYWSHYF